MDVSPTDLIQARALLAPVLAQRGGLCVLTGAGMSAESGIPTFRDALTGYWSQFEIGRASCRERVCLAV